MKNVWFFPNKPNCDPLAGIAEALGRQGVTVMPLSPQDVGVGALNLVGDTVVVARLLSQEQERAAAALVTQANDGQLKLLFVYPAKGSMSERDQRVHALLSAENSLNVLVVAEDSQQSAAIDKIVAPLLS